MLKKKVRIVMVGLLMTGGMCNAETPWKSLFNGTDLQDWSVQCGQADTDKVYWTVEDGAITVDSMGDKNHDYVWLMTDGTYSNFTLRLKFRIFRESPGNSGIQIRSRYDRDAEWLDGPQLDIHPPNPLRTGLIYDETRGAKRWIYPSLEPGNHRIPEDVPNRKLKLLYGEEGWNTMEITAEGTRITCRVNGEVVSDFDGAGVLDDAAHREHRVGLNGHIALQLHRRNELRAQFKDIFISEHTFGDSE